MAGQRMCKYCYITPIVWDNSKSIFLDAKTKEPHTREICEQIRNAHPEEVALAKEKAQASTTVASSTLTTNLATKLNEEQLATLLQQMEELRDDMKKVAKFLGCDLSQDVT